MIRAIASWLGLDRPAVGYALTLFVAATTAYTAACLLQIPNAYWAVMPIWVVAQPQRGVLLERAFFRVLGTLLGAGFGFGILQLLEQPFMVLAVLSLWVAVNSGLTHILRKVHSYIALMTGITAAVVVLPSLLLPGHSSEIALARVECTLIGVVMVTVITGLFTPNVQRNLFYVRVRKLAGDAVEHVANLLQSGEQDASERRILAEIAEVEAAASLVVAGSLDGYRRSRHVNAFIAASLALMAEGQMLSQRRARNNGELDFLPDLLSDFADQLRLGKHQEGVHMGLEKLIANARLANTRLAFVLEQLIAAEAALFSDGDNQQPAMAKAKTTIIGLAPHYEWVLARRTGLVSGSATFAAGALGLLYGKMEGELAALGVCIFSMILGSMPKPQVIAPEMLKGAMGGAVLAIFYRFTIQPHVATVPQLILSVAPFMLIGAFARVGHKTALPAIDANMCFLLASQAVLPAIPGAPAQILGGAAALILAAILVTGSFILLPRDPVVLASDAAQDIVNDLRRLGFGASRVTVAEWRPRALRQILRLMLHLGRARNLREMAPRGILAALNFGNAIIDIQSLSARPDLSTLSSRTLEHALGLLSDFASAPSDNASKLLTLAGRVDEPVVVTALQDAAYALQQGAALFEMGHAGKYIRNG